MRFPKESKGGVKEASIQEKKNRESKNIDADALEI
jgi:hypothetical protein